MGIRTGVWVGSALWLWVMGAPSAALANGFVVSASDGEQRVQRLAPLETLDLTAALDDEDARVSEVRFYRHIAPLPVATVTGRFYHSLVGPQGTRVVGATLQKEPLAGEVLDVEAADRLRRELTAALGEPSLLRDLGTPLFVSEPVELPSPGYGFLVEVETRIPWRPNGTLSGVDVPLDWGPDDIGTMTVEITATTNEPLKALYSPYHALAVRRDGDYGARAHYQGYAVCSRLDLTLLMSSGVEDLRLDVLPYRYNDADGGHVLALLTPPANAPEGGGVGRDIVLAVDTSGSMSGEKIEQAREALDGVLARLSPNDRITVVSFQTVVQALSDNVRSASPDGVDEARAFVDGLIADGGTNIHGALEASLGALPDDDDRPRYVVLLTDGQPTEGVTDVDAIVGLVAAYEGPHVRVFPFGVGYDVNTHLLDRLAGATGGHAIYVRPGQSVADPVESFFARIAAPVLAAPQLHVTGLGVSDVHPAALPDLYAGETLAVLARYANPGKGSVRVSGSANGRATTYEYAVTLPEHTLSAGFVPRVWALRHVGSLLSALKLGDGKAEAPLRTVAERYGVVTDFTGYGLDDNGDLHFEYSPVTLAASGAAAVEASASISGYAQRMAVEAAGTTGLRYHRDRAFVPVAGYHTDTTLAKDPNWIDLHFGSDRYHELAAHDAFAAGLLAIARDVRFEWLGHAYRVTDPAGALGEGLPQEVDILPAPLWMPDQTDPMVRGEQSPTHSETGVDEANAQHTNAADEGGALDGHGHTGGETPRRVRACQASHPGVTATRPGSALALLAFLACLLLAHRRRLCQRFGPASASPRDRGGRPSSACLERAVRRNASRTRPCARCRSDRGGR